MEDIPLLVAYFVNEYAGRMSKQVSRISSHAMDNLMRYPWPGNIRELQNLLERSVILTKGDVLQMPALPSRMPIRTEPVTLAEAERHHILKALDESNWVVGGSSGAAARLVTNHFQSVFRQPFIVENKPGNGNATGAAFVAQAAPDGHTLLVSNSASNLTVPLVARNAGYDPVTDFTHIVMLTSSPYVLAVYPGLGVKTLDAFIAKAKAEELTYTAANRGGLGHIAAEYLQRLAGFSMQLVAYRGGGPAVTDVIAGHVPAIILPVTMSGAQIRGGALVPLAISSRSRSGTSSPSRASTASSSVRVMPSSRPASSPRMPRRSR